MNVKTKTLVNVSLLIALDVVLSRFCSISTPVVRIGFGFVPIAICAVMYGPAWAGLTGALADILGANLFPMGSYFPGLTVSAALTGVVFGMFLHNKKPTLIQIGCAVIVNCMCISLLLSTFWLSILTGTSYQTLFPMRMVQCLIMLPVQFIVIRMLQKPISLFVRQSAYEPEA